MHPGFEYNYQRNVIDSYAWTHLQNATCKHHLPRVMFFAWVNPRSDNQWKVRVTGDGRSIANVGIRVW